jgi:hypothetical protein
MPRRGPGEVVVHTPREQLLRWMRGVLPPLRPVPPPLGQGPAATRGELRNNPEGE